MLATLIPNGGTVELIVGTDQTLQFTMLDSNGDPYDMTGSCDHQFLVKMNKQDRDDQALLNKTGASWTITDGPDGIVSLQINAEDRNASFKDGKTYPAQMWFVDSGGNQIAGWIGLVKAIVQVRQS